MNTSSDIATNNGFTGSIQNIFQHSVSTIQNRFEIFVLELKEEKARVMELLLWTSTALFLSIMTFMVVTAAVLFFFNPEIRIYAAAGLSLMYFVICGIAVGKLKQRIARFSKYQNQCLESLK